MALNLSLYNISSWPNSHDEFLARNPNKWCWTLLTQHSEASDIHSSHWVKVVFTIKILSSCFVVNQEFEAGGCILRLSQYPVPCRSSTSFYILGWLLPKSTTTLMVAQWWSFNLYNSSAFINKRSTRKSFSLSPMYLCIHLYQCELMASYFIQWVITDYYHYLFWY